MDPSAVVVDFDSSIVVSTGPRPYWFSMCLVEYVCQCLSVVAVIVTQAMSPAGVAGASTLKEMCLSSAA